MTKLNTSFIKSTLFEAGIPLGIKSACYFIDNLLQGGDQSEYYFVIMTTRKLDQLISIAYTNCLTFLVMMFAVHLIGSLIKYSQAKIRSKPQDASLSSLKSRVFGALKLLLCYTLLFGCYQLLLMVVMNNKASSLPLIPFSSRNLDQRNEFTNEEERLILSPALNPGEIVGSFPSEATIYIDSIFFAVSKDGKTLFTILEGNILAIFDISNPRNPQKKGQTSVNYSLSQCTLLSPDEKTLYIDSDKHLTIFDVSNHAAPALLITKPIEQDYILYRSIAITSDGKLLVTVNNQNLKIWDVSRPRYATVVFTKTYTGGGSIALSKDDTKLAIGKEDVFEIYSLANSRLNLLCSQSVNGRVHSIVFSADESRVILGLSEAIPNSISMQKIMIFGLKDFLTPSLLVSKPLSKEQPYGKLWFHANREFAFYDTRHEFKILRLSDLEENVLFTTSSELYTVPFAASPDSKVNVLYFAGMINVLRFNIDVAPPKSFFHFKPSALKVIDEVDYNRNQALALTPDEKNFFLVRSNKTNQYYVEVVPYGRKTCSTFENLNPSASFYSSCFAAAGVVAKWSLVAGKTVIVVNYRPYKYCNSTIFVVDITDKNKFQTILSFQQETTKAFSTSALAITNNEKNIIFVNDANADGTDFRLNIKTLNNKRLESTLTDYPLPRGYYCQAAVFPMMVSKNDNFLFIASCYLFIYNINNLQLPRLESSFDFGGMPTTSALAFSKDETLLYSVGVYSNGLKKLFIINISNTRAPKLISSIQIQRDPETEVGSIELTQDEKTLFIGFADGLLMLDIRDKTQPKEFGFNYFLEDMYASKLVNNGTILYSASALGVTAFDATSSHILYIKNSNFLIGDSNSITLNVLKLNNNFNFDYIMDRHKFLKVSLFDSSNKGSAYSALPSWITFNEEQSLIKIEPNSASSKGVYKIVVGLSTQVKPTSFSGLGSIYNDATEAENLMLNLLQSGYIDNRRYLSKDLDLTREQLRIDPKYKKIEKDIRLILLKNYIEAIGEISVSSSLSLSTNSKNLQISSLSKNTISVAIQLVRNSRSPYFLTKTYAYTKSTITNERSVLLLEGTLGNINEALKEVLIDLDQLSACDGRINITDGINPQISEPIASISKFFKNNSDTIRISKNGSVEVSSISQNPLVSVTLQLIRTSRNPYFLTKTYPFVKSTITNERSLLLLEGALDSVNEALKEVLIELDQLPSCNGIASVNDNVNPVVSRPIESISKYFMKSTDRIYVSNNKHLQVSFLNKNAISVTIQLVKSSRNPYFLTKTYPFIKSSITNERSVLILDGSLDNINEALKEVLVDLDQLSSCNGIINATDGINPAISLSFNPISQYFVNNNDVIHISKNGSLEVSSINPNPLVSVTLQLIRTSRNPYFLTKTYPFVKSTITNERALLLLEGALDSVNEALKEVLIELDQLPSCNGIVSVNDNVNPVVSRPIESISKYFMKSTDRIYVSNNKHLQVSFLNKNAISVTIQLVKSSRNPYFLTKTYPFIKSSITNERSVLILDGSLDNINEALKEVLIELDQLPSYCGTITATDGINPAIAFSSNSISQYFINNSDVIRVSKNGSLEVSSINQNPLVSVTLQLIRTSRNPYFLTKTYPFVKSTITNERLLLLLEGALDSVNEALKEVLIELDQLSSCNGIVSVNDNVNPVVSRPIESISKYFMKSTDRIYVSNNKYLQVSFLNKNAISVTIQLVKSSRNPYFLTKTYPFIKSSITNERSVLILDGSLDNINEALKEVLIDLDQLSSFNGIINATDGINPALSLSFNPISQYFINNTDMIHISINGYLEVSSINPNPLVSVTLQLIRTSRNPYFLTKTYPFVKSTITNERALLLLEGTLDSVNEALKEVLIELDQLPSCNGIASVNDNVNPVVSRPIESISKYFMKSTDRIFVSNNKHLQVSFLNKNAISVTIQLAKSSRNPYFLTKTYPFIKSSITNERSVLILDGSLDNINEALKEVLVDLDQLSSCNGIINATDGINPAISLSFNPISQYFVNNNDVIHISKNGSLEVSSINPNPLVSVTLQLIRTSRNPYFLTKTYPFVKSTITNERALLLLEGALDSVNEALKEVLIELDQLPSCNGIASVNDNVNPVVSRPIESISKYFMKSTDRIFVSNNKHLQVSFLNKNAISVTIQLAKSSRNPYFLTKTYPFIKSSIPNDERSVLILDGTLDNINEALKEVLIDLDQLSSCNGTITATDGINPALSLSFNPISQYFINNTDVIRVSKNGSLELSFLHKNAISVAIQLMGSFRKPYFLTKTYPFIRSSITNERSVLLLEGSLENINEALKEVLINLDQLSSCNGMINVTDNINPPISRYIPSISTHFTSQGDTIYISNNHLRVSSLYKDHLIVTIQLDQKGAHFVNKPYSFVRVTIANSKTLMYLEGSMDDINEVLETILIDLGELEDTGAVITLSDGVNPSTSKQFKSISGYFQKNANPYYNLNLPIQDQISKRPFFTGLYSMVELNPATFIDNNSLSLEYSLEMEDSSQELPSWISLKGLSLMGTPPEKYKPLVYNFKLKVKNEFREKVVPFTLDIGISFTYGAKLVSTFIGYIISFVGIVLSLNKIYNVLAKRHYRYPQSFKLIAGEKITDKDIFPVAFVKNEMAKSKKIFKALKKYVNQNYYGSSLLEKFIISKPQILDKEKIIATLDLLDDKYYKQASSFSRGIIQQLIINMMVETQISSKQERHTMKIFNKVKDKWMNLVFPKALSYSACPQFTISAEKLEKELMKISPEILIEEPNLDDTHVSAELLLPSPTKSKVNMDLLKNKILAHAFTYQNLNINSILIDVISYKKLKGDSLWHSIKRFLLKDLKPFVVLNKREIGYGIEYNIDDDVLFFSGLLTHDLKDNIIVVHLKNNRGRILREFWITAPDEEVRENSYMDQVAEQL